MILLGSLLIDLSRRVDKSSAEHHLQANVPPVSQEDRFGARVRGVSGPSAASLPTVEGYMRRLMRVMMWVLPFVICVSFASARQTGSAQGSAAGIGGAVVNATTGRPEPGVWVIAETKLQTGFRKIVVTDDEGRFFVPDLPTASYELWVRGYGLKDSAKTKAERGSQVRSRQPPPPLLARPR